MILDLHFHPSFFWGKKFHITEPFGIPSLDKIVYKASEKKIYILAITSCSDAFYRDKRWENYTREFGNGDQFLFYSTTRERNDVALCHGQEFKTDGPDVNVLFAEKIIPIKASSKIHDKVDFEYLLNSARDSGKNVIIAIPAKSFWTREDRRNDLNEGKLRELYEKGKFDCLESYDAMAPWIINKQSTKIASNWDIPGIAVSDGHRLEDLGKSYIEIFDSDNLSDIANKIKEGEFIRHEYPLSLTSKGLYTMRLASSIANRKIKS